MPRRYLRGGRQRGADSRLPHELKSVHSPAWRSASAASVIMSFAICSALLVLAACSPQPPSLPPPTPTFTLAVVTPSATVSSTPSTTPVPPNLPTEAPPYLPEYLDVAIPTIDPSDPMRFSFPTAIAYPTPKNWRPPLAPVPLSVRPQDHFWFTRPIASDSVNYPLWSYRYGSNEFGGAPIHAGIDIDAPLHTPVRAAGPGVVVWAGWGLFTFTPGREDDPYGIAVEIRHDFGYKNRPLYTLYGHLEAIKEGLYVGQRVQTGDILGWVGITGRTTGPHVHFEVRQGKNDYYYTRNPELWIAPYSGWGVLAGQLLDDRGRYIVDTAIAIHKADGQYVTTVYTYGYRVANPDDEWRENFAISDLPAGEYLLRAILPPTGEITTTDKIEGLVTVIPDQTTFVLLKQGVGLIPNFLPPPSTTPPHPTNTYTPSATPSLTPTPSPTRTATASNTPRPTRTPLPTLTPRPSRTPRAEANLP